MRKILFLNLFLFVSLLIFCDDQMMRESLQDADTIFNYDKKSRDIFSGVRNINVSKKSNKKREKIAIIYLKPVNATLELSDAVSQNLSFMISSQKILQVVDNIEFSKRMNDYSADFAIRQAKLGGAAFALCGTLTQIGDKYSINIQILNAETQEVVSGINETAESESDLFNVLKKIAYNISKDDNIVKKYLKDLKKAVVFDFDFTDYDKIKTQQITETIIYDLSDYNKYWAIDKIERDKVIKELNIKEAELNNKDNLMKIAKKLEAKIYITGKIYKSGENYLVDASGIDTDTGNVVYKKTFKTKYEYQIVYIAERIPELFSLQKENRISDEILNVDIEKYEIIEKQSKISAIALFSTGLSLSLIGFGATTSGVIVLATYLYKVNNGLTYTLAGYEQYYTVSTILLLSIGSPLLITGIILAALSSIYFERQKQYGRYIKNEKKISFSPLIDGNNKEMLLGMQLKF